MELSVEDFEHGTSYHCQSGNEAKLVCVTHECRITHSPVQIVDAYVTGHMRTIT